jgi:hypothetical protein
MISGTTAIIKANTI